MIFRSSLAAVLLMALPPSFQAASQSSPQAAKPPSASQPAPNESANALVKSTIQNEVNAIDNDHTHWMYQSQTRKDGAMVTEEVVETPRANIERVIARNGQPLSPDEQKQEDEKVEKFVNDTAAQHKQRGDLDADGKKSKEMLEMLPNALTYTYAGHEGNRTKLTFQPNPDFHPPSREAKVFAAMEGTMVIDTKEHRLVEFSGHLTKPVKFGGGLLGDLDAGGTFDVRQLEAGPHHWEISLLKVNIKGKALIFKTISEQQDERDTHFKRVPDHLTLTQAFDLAKKQQSPSEKAQSGN